MSKSTKTDTETNYFSLTIAARALAASTVAYLEPQSRGLTFTAYRSIVNDALLPPFSEVVSCGCNAHGNRGGTRADNDDVNNANDNYANDTNGANNKNELERADTGHDKSGVMQMVSSVSHGHIIIDAADPNNNNPNYNTINTLKRRFTGSHEIKEIYDRSGKQTVRCLCAVMHAKVTPIREDDIIADPENNNTAPQNHEIDQNNINESAEKYSFVPPSISITFRGTDTLENAIADVKAIRVLYGDAPRAKVHAGFRDAWIGDRLQSTVMNYVCEKVDELTNEIQELESAGLSNCTSSPNRAEDSHHCGAVVIDINGHSLGGSIAVLAAYDLAKMLSTKKTSLSNNQSLPSPSSLSQKRTHIRVYTVGCPRVGNVRFANDFNQMVPECWNVINSNDIVPAIPYSQSTIRNYIPCWKNTGYRRHGRAVIITDQGDMIINPTKKEKYKREARVLRVGKAIKSHETARYRASIRAAIQKEKERPALNVFASGVSVKSRQLFGAREDSKKLDQVDELLARLEEIIIEARADPTRSTRILPGAT